MISMKSIFNFGGFSSSYGVLNGIVSTKMNAFIIHPYSSPPFIRSLANTDAHDVAGTMRPSVGGVSKWWHVSKINQSIVSPIMVYVVNLLGPVSINHRPDYPMGIRAKIHDAPFVVTANANTSISLYTRIPTVPVVADMGGSASLAICKHAPWTFTPIQLPSVRLVSQKVAKFFGGWYGSLIHLATSFRRLIGTVGATTLGGSVHYTVCSVNNQAQEAR